MKNYREYQSQIKKEFEGCVFDNIKPLTEFQLKKFHKKRKLKEERVKKAEYCLHVEDESMSHTSPEGHFFPKGSRLYIAPTQAEPITPGCYVIAEIDGHAKPIFRRLKPDSDDFILSALNPEFPDITVGFSIVGKVIDVEVELSNWN